VRPLLKLTGTELRLFLREPITVVFTLALPLMVLYLLGGVFGNATDPGGEVVVFRGFGATNWYTPAYVAVAISGLTLISAPAHLIEYRETGVLRRLRASGVSKTTVLASQFLISVLIAGAGALILLVVALAATDVDAPVSWLWFAVTCLLATIVLVLLGLALGALLPTARAAQSVGLVLWFMFLLICGGGPPPEVLPDSLRTFGQWLPMTPVIQMVQEPWLTGAWAWHSTAVALGIGAASAAVAWWRFRWE
jgi:ABC-2 type transport system permease protein